MDETRHGLIIDLNKYRPGKNLKQYLDAGVDGFIFRIGGPAAWVEGNWQYQEDATWRSYLEQADKIGIPRDRIGGYIIHNPFEDWRLEQDVHLDCLNQWTSGGYMPGYFILDHEIATCWRGSTKITATPFNLVSSMEAVMSKMWKKYRKPVMLYTGRWFIDTNGQADHIIKLDNINGPATGKQWGMWYAAYLQTQLFDLEQYGNLRDALKALPTPTGDTVGKLLQCGSYSLYDLWQFTDRLKITGDSVGVDANVTRGTIDEYWKLVGAKVGPVEPPTEPEEPEQPEEPESITHAALMAKLDQILARINAIYK